MSDAKLHLGVLDGWRGISILLVLAAHLLPLGPKAWGLNEAAGPMGMALFFTLSGFLITRVLLAGMSVPAFLVRRVLRIVPLAWLTLLITFPMLGVASANYVPNFLFYANLPPYYLVDATAHFWSLSVEMQFYVGVALLVALFGTRGLMLLPVICAVVTLQRISAGAHIQIVTWHRVDEILAGAMLAMAYGGKFGAIGTRWLARLNAYVVLLLFAISCHPGSGFMNYVRPYLAAALVGCTLFNPSAALGALLKSSTLRYIAAISFALYVIHGVLLSTWLGSGDKLVKYMKRPLLIAVTFALAHLSTFYYEQRWIDLAKRLSSRFYPRTS